MGMFSWSCLRCGKSMISVYSAGQHNSWMIDVVVLLPSGSIVRGTYDGYGRVEHEGGVTDIHEGPEPACWHKSCWILAGRPTEYTKASPHAGDQGHFYDDDSDVPDPLVESN